MVSHTDVSLPPIFGQFATMVRYVQQWSRTEYSSTCVKCGGEVHSDGSWPDRCRWFNDSNPRAWCRVCGEMFWPNQAPGYKPPTAEQLYQWTQERLAQEEARKRSAERAIANLKSSRLWERYQEQMGKEGKEYWEKAGIPSAWQDVFRFGWCPEFRFMHKTELFVRPSATIPIFGLNWEPLQIKHRIIWEPSAPPELQSDKYRPEIKDVGSPFFLCDPSKEIEGEIIVVEGEKKAAVVKVTLDDSPEPVIGLPGIEPDRERLSMFDKAERILLVTDPGEKNRKKTWDLCKLLGKQRCRVCIPNRGKIDDLIVESGMTKFELRSLFRQAIPAA